MPSEQCAGYLSGDPRYGLQGEALKDYYRVEYARKSLQQFLCTGPKTGTPEFFREHLHAHESYFASYGDSFIFRGPIRSADGVPCVRLE